MSGTESTRSDPAPKVSALICTYNHGPVIAQAIESTLMQQTNFPFEIVIGEDFSTDGTREIVAEYQRRYPQKIRALLHEKNLGKFGLINFAHTLAACRGQYVALLDGDDYWTSPHKLQKQADFLDAHPECSTCYHNVLIESARSPDEKALFHVGKRKPFSDLGELLRNGFLATSSVMSRHRLFGDFPDWYYTAKFGDIIFHTLNSQYGTFGYLDETMSVYRVHSLGTWTTKSLVDRSLGELEVYGLIDAFLKGRHREAISSLINQRYFFLALGYDELGDPAKSKEYLKKYIRGHRRHPTVPLRQILRLSLKVYFPRLFKMLKRLHGN